MDDVFEICEVSDDKVIIKVNTDDLLAIARHVGLDANAAYITVTRGKDHVLSVIKKDGTSYSFDWGESGYTLISNRLEALRLDVIDFIHENGIVYEIKGHPISAIMFYNRNCQSWQMTVHGCRECGYIFNREARNAEDMIEFAEKFFGGKEWIYNDSKGVLELVM